MASKPGRGSLPTTPATSSRMSRQASRNTAVERSLRSVLHRAGYRFRVHQRPLRDLRREADIVFRKARVAVFVDGCFWHACPIHGTWPATNVEFWRAKIEGNAARDRETDTRLRAAGWEPVRVWEHEAIEEAAQRVMAVVRSRL
ncbi:very short patch repair endonuclease [Actinopolymorpha sp. NPDC004070]|uniref:very short patch repair endonuclease n=1 Tax=Actinopolymorpha sp. NPDC004070 TaxID=3154548 RepID=UPI0033A09A5F